MTVSLHSDGPVNGPNNNINITQFGLYSEASPDFSASDINVTQYGWGVEDVKGITLIQDYIDKAQAIYQDVLNAKSLLQVLIQEASEVESFYQEIKKVQEDIHQKYPIIVDQYNQIVSLARDVNDSRDAASVSAKAASDKVVQAQGILTQMQGLNNSVQSALTNVNTHYNEIVVLRDEVKAINTESKQLVEDLRKGQVYRGTWNPHSGAWPDPKGTYSAWDVVLNPKEASFDWNGVKWLPGDRLLYILSEARYEQVESGVGVLSVNSKSGYVTLVPNDLGAYTKAEVDAKITPKFNTAGGTLTGAVTGPSFVQSGAQGTTATSLTRKDYVDGLLATKVDKTITVNRKPLSGSVSLTSDDVGARSITWVPGWTDITGVPTIFPPSAHQHSWGDLTGVPVQATRWPTFDEITGKPAGYPVAGHTHPWGEITGKPDFATRWPTASEVKARPDTWNPSSLVLVNKDNANVMTGVGYNAFSNTADAINFPSGVIGSGYEIVNGQADGKTLDSSVFQLWIPNDSPDIFTRTGDGSATGWVFRSWDKMYTSNNKPSSTDVVAVAKAGDTMTGKLIVPSFTDRLTGIGEAALPYKTLALADWGGVVGQTTFAKPESIGAPSGTSGGYWNVLGKRDGAGGYAGLYIPYAHSDNRIFIGRNESGNNAPTWIKVYTDINKPTPAEIGAMAASPAFVSTVGAKPFVELHKPGVIAGMYSFDSANFWTLSQTNGNGISGYDYSKVNLNTAQQYIDASRWTTSQSHWYADQWGQWSPITVDFGESAGTDDYYPVIKGRHVIGGQGYTTDVEFGVLRAGNNWGQAIIRVGSAEGGTAGTMATYNFDIGGNFTASGAVSGGTLKSGGGGVYTTGQLAINNSNPTLWLQDTDNRSAAIHNNSNLLSILRGQGDNAIAWDGGPNGRHPMTLNLESGDVVFSGNVVAYSDRRLKKDVKPLENALEKVMKLDGVNYKRIGNDTDRVECGFIAQDLQEVIPEVVIEQTDEDKTLAVDYAKMNAYLVEAIKEQQKMIEELKYQIDEIKGGTK